MVVSCVPMRNIGWYFRRILMEDYTEFDELDFDVDFAAACASCEIDELDFVDVSGFAADIGAYRLR